MAALALVAFTILTRLPALLCNRPIDDEAVYGVVARVMLAGGLPYRDAIERKPPLLFEVYRAVLGAFGPYNWLALHAVALAWTLATMAALFLMMRARFDARTGLVAAAFYAVLQPWATAKDLAFNGEMLMNLPLAAAFAVLFQRQRPSDLRGALAGSLVGIAFLLKQPAAIAIVPVLIHVARRRGLAAALLTAAAFAVPIAMAGAALWRAGLFADAFYWTITDHTVPHVFGVHGALHTLLFIALAWPLLYPQARPEELRRAWAGCTGELVIVLVWVGVSLVGAAAGGRFYPHYYIQLVLPLAALAAPFWSRRFARTGRWTRLDLPVAAAGWLLLVGLVTSVVQAIQLAQAEPVRPAARFVRDRAAPGDRLFVWGQETLIYEEARMLPATRYIATFPLTGYVFGGRVAGIDTRQRIVPGAWANFAADFAAHPPRFIIDTQAGADAQFPMRDFPALRALIDGRYHPVARFSATTVYAANRQD